MIDVQVADTGLNINVTIEGSGPPGKPGADGVSPTVNVAEIENGHKVTITDKDGEKSFEVTNGRDGTDGTDGKSPYVGENGHWFEWQDGDYVDTGKVAEGRDGKDGIDGRDGNDGVSPIVEVAPTETGHTVSITDRNGEKTFTVKNGQNGKDGQNGVSPTVSVEDVEGGHKVIITGADGPKEFIVLNGKNGDPGDPGENGQTPSISIGTVETLSADSLATAEITGQTPNLTLNIGIPQGREGPAGLGLPTPTQEDAGKVPMVNPEGNGYIFGEAGGGKIDDTTLGRDTTWSSLNIVDSLAPAFDASGSVVTCNPVSGYPLSVTSQIMPAQDGEGEPSPDNVRPVNGWDEASLWIVGKNLFNLSGDINRNNLGKYQGDFNFVEDGVLTANANSSGMHLIGQIIHVKKGTPVIFSFDMLSTGTGRKGYVALYELGSPHVGISEQPQTPGHYVSREYTPKTDIIVFAFGTAGGKGAKYKNISLTFKNEGGEYEPYNGLAYVTTFKGTVYGGVLDLVSGVLTVTKEKVILTGSEVWSSGPSFNGYSTSKSAKYKDAFLPVCNIAKGVISDQTTGHTIRAAYGSFRFQGFADTFQDLDSFKVFLQSQNAEIVCELTEPFTVQLTPTEILALSGVNTLYTNTGDTTVVGRADPDATIKGLLSRIDALEKAAVGGG